MVDCKEVATAVSSGEIESAGFFRKLAIRFHLWMCDPCRIYVRQMRQMGEAARRAFGAGAAEDTSSELEATVLERCAEAARKKREAGEA
jgi:hypothetical protein